MTNKALTLLGSLALAASATLHAAPKVLTDYLPVDTPVKGEVIAVVPPEAIEPYMAKVQQAAQSDPEWFSEFSREATPGVPLPFHEKLGLTKEEYDDYLKLWGEREFRPIQQLVIQLIQPQEGEWAIHITGGGEAISILRYIEKDDVFRSPNGTLARIEDIDAEETSILGGWTGHEWRFDEETSLGRTKENFAIGRMKNGQYHLLVYRAQEVSSQGTRLYDKSLVIRFTKKPATE